MKKSIINSSRVPVYRDSGFELYDADTTSGRFRDETSNEREPEMYIYSRYRNPTVVAAEDEIMKLEGCRWALLTQSGMSAVDTALSVFHRGKETGPWLFFSEIYGGTLSYCESILRNRRAVDVRYFEPESGRCNTEDYRKVIHDIRPDLFYVETVSNPLLLVVDLPEIIKISKEYGVKVVVDNTFATPWLFRPLDYGADLVIHSATKYLSGHGNITAGAICGNDPDIMKAALEYRKFTGHMLSPDDAYRLSTQIKTFQLRYEKQCSNAAALASWFERSDAVEKTYFPGLESHTTHKEAVKIMGMKGFGAMITIDLAGKSKEQKKARRDSFIKNVSGKIKLIPTLGDPSTILMPVESVWGAKYPEPGMIRLSVGFEQYEELEETVSEAVRRM